MKEGRFYVPYGRFDQVCRTLKREGSDLSFRQMMERAAWLRTSMAFGRELVMGNFWRTHCGWIMPDGTVQTMGKGIGNAGRLDTKSWKDIIAVDAVSDGLVGVRKDGAVLYTGNDKKLKKALSGLKNIIQIYCNGYDVYALDADGGVWKRATDFFYRHNVPAARQVVGDKNGKTAVLLADGTIGGDFARSDWTDMVWIGLCDGGINSKPLIYGLDAQGKVHISDWDLRQFADGGDGVISVAVRCDLVSGQRTLFALQCSGNLAFSGIWESFNSSYDNKRGVTSYISLWDNHSGDVRGIVESGVLNELALQYTWDGTIPKQLPVK